MEGELFDDRPRRLVHMHQPHFLPSVQYFHRMARCDVFLFADDVQHQRGYWEHKNRILVEIGRAHV